ncbi:Uncharacterized protein TCM_027546 [Theobroma cacao]|uniref:Uncharacterized protein n=1 Tax=Theobroma cacao TaxID=3641 RepID=A0A061G8D6_THECC|nr:Uncharacterized protein TCM_027546 [Theobroma cacao]
MERAHEKGPIATRKEAQWQEGRVGPKKKKGGDLGLGQPSPNRIGLTCNHRRVQSTTDSDLIDISSKVCSGLGGSSPEVSNTGSNRERVVTIFM